MVSHKWIHLLVLVGFALATTAGAVTAQAENEISFGIRPTKAFADRPETFSYFSHILTPGDNVTDEALVINDGGVPIVLRIYATDGITAQNGGTAFTKPGEQSSGASRGANGWISLPVAEISLGPGEEQLVPFSISVPSDAAPGHHVGGLVVEAQPVASEITQKDGETQFGVNVVRRVGVAVVMDVVGEHVTGMAINSVRLHEQSEQGATFRIDVHNSGNVFTKGEGFLLIKDRSGKELTSIPWNMDTVLPGDMTYFMVNAPIILADSDYFLTVVLLYDGKTALLENVEVNVRDGQPVVAGEPAGQTQISADITRITPSEGAEGVDLGSGSNRVWLIGVIALLVVVLIVAEVIIWRKVWKLRDRHVGGPVELPRSW